jgi:uroporphyrinogen-III synthase
MAAADVARPLAGLRVLVTRPAAQAQRLAALIEQAGGEAVRFPTLEIAAPRDMAALERVLADVARFDLAIFISPNAVTHGLACLRSRGGLPPRLAVAAIGRGTAAALAQADIANIIVPAEGADSEGLLALAALQNVAGKRVVIFRGEGGRELLGDTLRARGAEVQYAECYRRARPATDAAPLNARLERNGIDIVTVTSVETLHNLHDMVDAGARARLRRLPIVVVGSRQAEACRTLGWAHAPVIARDAGDEAILATLKAWRGTQNSL